MIILSSKEPLWYVSASDSAVDDSIPNFQSRVIEVMKSPRSATKLPLKPGAVPAEFQLSGLTVAQDKYVASKSESERSYERLAYGLRGIRGVKKSDGSDFVLRRQPSELGDRVHREDLAVIWEGAKDVCEELATVVDRLSFVDPLSGSGSESSQT